MNRHPLSLKATSPKNRIIRWITYHIKKLEGNLLQRHRCTKNCIPLSRCNRMRPARTWTAGLYGGSRGEGAAINTAINRRHKSLALLPVPCVSISLSPRYRPQAWIWEPSRATTREQEHRQRGDVGKVRFDVRRGRGGGRGKGERDTHPRCRVERRPTHGRVSIRGLPRGWVLDNALVTSNTDTSRGVYRGPRGVGQIGPLDLVRR